MSDKKQKMTNAIRALWPHAHPTMQEGRYAINTEGLRHLVEDVVKYGKPRVLEVYHSDPLVPPQRETLV